MINDCNCSVVKTLLTMQLGLAILTSEGKLSKNWLPFILKTIRASDVDPLFNLKHDRARRAVWSFDFFNYFEGTL